MGRALHLLCRRQRVAPGTAQDAGSCYYCKRSQVLEQCYTLHYHHPAAKACYAFTHDHSCCLMVPRKTCAGQSQRMLPSRRLRQLAAIRRHGLGQTFHLARNKPMSCCNHGMLHTARSRTIGTIPLDQTISMFYPKNPTCGEPDQSLTSRPEATSKKQYPRPLRVLRNPRFFS